MWDLSEDLLSQGARISLVIHDARFLVADGHLKLINLLPVLDFQLNERLLVDLEVEAELILKPLDVHHELMFFHC